MQEKLMLSVVLLEYLKSKHGDQNLAEFLGTRLPCVSTRLPLWYTPTVTGEKRDVEYTSGTRSIIQSKKRVSHVESSSRRDSTDAEPFAIRAGGSHNCFCQYPA